MPHGPPGCWRAFFRDLGSEPWIPMHEVLFTPWRYAYITAPKASADTGEEGCFFCRAADDSDDPERLVVHRTVEHQVVLNRHHYNNGHVMVAPLAHWASPTEADAAARDAFWPLVLKVQRTLERAYSPDGLNMGLNLGRAAGAGVPGHFHFHLVPRWNGDSNFLGVVAGTRTVPEDLHRTWLRLRALFAEEGG